MNTLLLITLFLPTVSFATTSDDLPGESYARPAAGTVLRAGPSADHVGVLTLDGATVVRLGTRRGTFREIFVPAGFPIYMHGDYVALQPEEARARVRGHRVNMRLLPATEGNMPIGQLSEDARPLDLLGTEGHWARLLAPVGVPLYVFDEQAAPVPEGEGHAAWEAATAQREERRQRAAAHFRATDPGWQQTSAWRQEFAELATLELSVLDEEGLARLRADLDRLAQRPPTAEDAEGLARLRSVIERHQTIEAEVAARVDRLRREEGLQPEQLAQEARILGLGLSFARHGEAITARGRVRALHGEGETTIFTLHSEQQGEDRGQVYKLSAPEDVADLAALVGKEVTLTGRKLALGSVKGPVIVVHRVLLVRR